MSLICSCVFVWKVRTEIDELELGGMVSRTASAGIERAGAGQPGGCQRWTQCVEDYVVNRGRYSKALLAAVPRAAGIGNKLSGLVASLVLAVIMQRQLLIEWPAGEWPT